ncbi:MAG: VOC family protein [Gammaproteobacteria bacterium]|nr:VOC family protein [Gammaproteobacteria bacterium]
MDIPLGRIVWYQLNATDMDAAVEFYCAINGWKSEEWPASDDPYVLLSTDSGTVGGVMAIPAEAQAGGAPQHWLMYIATPDVERSAAQAVDNGASVYVPPADLPDVGRFAVLADPQGAAFALYAPTEPPQDKPFAPGLGDVSWHELVTTNYAAAMNFYGEQFGWVMTEAMDMGDMGAYQMFGRHGVSLGGMYNKTPDMPAPPRWLLYFKVRDVQASAQQVAGLGGKVLNGPMEVPGGDFIVQCLDPQGGAFALHSARPAA